MPCLSTKKMKPVLDRLANRYEIYAGKYENELNTDFNKVVSYVNLSITTITNYIIFGEVKYIET